jgi:hypothetical protein
MCVRCCWQRLRVTILDKNLARASMYKMAVGEMTKVEIGSEKEVDPWRRWRCYFSYGTSGSRPELS